MKKNTALVLKQCPCCGEKADFKYRSGSWGYYSAKHAIQCSGCGLETPWIDDKEVATPKGKPTSAEQAKAEAAGIWNRRIVENEA